MSIIRTVGHAAVVTAALALSVLTVDAAANATPTDLAAADRSISVNDSESDADHHRTAPVAAATPLAAAIDRGTQNLYTTAIFDSAIVVKPVTPKAQPS